MSIGERIRKARKKLLMSQTELAKAIGVSVTYICRVEKGKIKEPKATLLKKIANTLNVSLDYLIGFTEDSDEPFDENIKFLIDNYKMLRNEKKALIKHIIEYFVFEEKLIKRKSNDNEKQK